MKGGGQAAKMAVPGNTHLGMWETGEKKQEVGAGLCEESYLSVSYWVLVCC